MTDTTTTTETETETTEMTEQEQDAEVTAPDAETTAPEVEETEDAPSGNKEAAKYRRQLRETETERDTLRTDLETARRDLLTHVLGGSIKGHKMHPDVVNELDPSILFASGVLDQAALDAQLDQLRAERAYFFTPDRRNVAPREGSTPESSRASGWADAFKPE